MGNAKEWRWSIGQRHKQCYLWGWLLAALSKTLIISLQIKALGSVPTFFSSSGSFFPVCVLSRLGPFANSYNWDVHFPLRLIDHLLCLLSTGQLWAVSSWSQRRSIKVDLGAVCGQSHMRFSPNISAYTHLYSDCGFPVAKQNRALIDGAEEDSPLFLISASIISPQHQTLRSILCPHIYPGPSW